METGNWKGGWFNALMKCFNAFVPLPSWLDDASLQHHLFIYFTNHTLHFFCFGNQCHTFGKECLGNLGTLFSYSHMANSYSISIPKKNSYSIYSYTLFTNGLLFYFIHLLRCQMHLARGKHPSAPVFNKHCCCSFWHGESTCGGLVGRLPD